MTSKYGGVDMGMEIQSKSRLEYPLFSLLLLPLLFTLLLSFHLLFPTRTGDQRRCVMWGEEGRREGAGMWKRVSRVIE
jgi:hypothetical protein